MMKRRVFVWVALLLLATLLSACGSARKTAMSPKPAGPASSPAAKPAPMGTPSNAQDQPATPSGAVNSPAMSDSAKKLQAGSGDMTYQNYGINPIVSAARQPISTFGVDVDTPNYFVV